MPQNNLGEKFAPRPDSYGFEGMLADFAPEEADPMAGTTGPMPAVGGPAPHMPMPSQSQSNPNAGKGSF